MAGGLMQLVAYGQAEYEAIGSRLAIDPTPGSSSWPAGLLSHAAGPTGDGRWAIMEVWESRDAQSRFMQERLGPAIQQSGVTAVPETTWVDIVAYHVAPGAGTG
jgi:hypothetical protein